MAEGGGIYTGKSLRAPAASSRRARAHHSDASSWTTRWLTTGEIIFEYRKKAGLTQEELTDKLGVSRQAVSKWEQDAAFPETEKILELCKLFSISADELLFGRKNAGASSAGAEEAPAAPSVAESASEAEDLSISS